MSYFTKRSKRIVAGTLVGALALSVSPIIGFTGIASAADALPPIAEPIGDGNFCEDAPTTEPFTDVSASDPSLDEIICLVATELTKGTTATTYSPNASITRRQMALFIKRLADLANELDTGTQVAALPADDGTTAPFTDIEGESAEAKAAISQLNTAGIVQGTTATTYSPGANVSRRQMAAFINRLEKFLTGAEFTTTKDFFNDDNGDTGEANLNAVASVGIFQGDGAGNVFPGADLTRRQMANVLLRHAQVMFEQGDIKRAFPEDDSAAGTTRPELVSASVGATTTAAQVTPTNPLGTRITYVYDEPIALFPAAAGNHLVYNADGTEASGGQTIISQSGNTVVVNHAAVDTVAKAAQLTVATVEKDAVTDNQGQGNPEGDAAIGTNAPAGTGGGEAGITNAPDLVSVGNFRAGAVADTTAVDFTFDEAAWVEAVDGFDLIAVNGVELDCTGPLADDAVVPASGGTSPGGNGTTVITVLCDNIVLDPDTPLTAAAIARGTVVAGSLSDTAAPAGNLNELQAADVSSTSTNPDLVSATFQPSAGVADDKVLFVFDENVMDAVFGLFAVYDIGGTSTVGTAAVINPGNPTQVLVSFPDATLSDAVGATVVDAAVDAVDNGAANQQDEVGVANAQATPARVPGQTAEAELRGVALAIGVDQFNNPTGYQATFTFDEPIKFTGVTAAAFSLYLADGTDLVATTCARVAPDGSPAGTAGENQVRCTAFGAATSAQIGSATVGTVNENAVDDADDTAAWHPEGAELTTGGTGTPAS